MAPLRVGVVYEETQMSDIIGIDVSQSCATFKLDGLIKQASCPDYWKLWQRTHSGSRAYGLRASRPESLRY